MEFTVPKKELLRLVTRANGIADRKSVMAILGGALLTAEAGKLTVAATDLYMAVSSSCDADVRKPGHISLDAKNLLDRVKAMPEGPIQVSVKDQVKVAIKAGSSARRYTMTGNSDDFPKLPSRGDNAVAFSLPTKALLALIARTSFAISADETRANLNSLLIEQEGKRLRVVATDGHRLALADLEMAEARTTSMLIPRKAIGELRHLAEETTDENIELAVVLPNLFIDPGAARFSVKLVDAVFPPYEQVIPKSSPSKIVVGRAAFSDALRAVSVAAQDKGGGVLLSEKGGKLYMRSESAMNGDGVDEIDMELAGPTFKVGVNSIYVREVLDALDCDSVCMGVGADLDPVVFRPVGATDFVGIVMPLHL